MPTPPGLVWQYRITICIALYVFFFLQDTHITFSSKFAIAQLLPLQRSSLLKLVAPIPSWLASKAASCPLNPQVTPATLSCRKFSLHNYAKFWERRGYSFSWGYPLLLYMNPCILRVSYIGENILKGPEQDHITSSILTRRLV